MHFILAAKADRILMMEGGKIVEQGTHAELMAIAGGKYAKREFFSAFLLKITL